MSSSEKLIRKYLDEGWDGPGWSPYQLLVIGESIFATQQSPMLGHNHPRAESNAMAYRNIVLGKARDRYREGFYADPFTKEPKMRKA